MKKDYLMNETVEKINGKVEELEKKIDELKYLISMIDDMKYYCIKRDEEYNRLYDEEGNQIYEFPTDPYAIMEYEKRKNIIDIVVKAIL